ELGYQCGLRDVRVVRADGSDRYVFLRRRNARQGSRTGVTGLTGSHSTGISPPSRSIVAPCSQLARAETANTTRLPTSSTAPMRMGLLNSRNNCSRIF